MRPIKFWLAFVRVAQKSWRKAVGGQVLIHRRLPVLGDGIKFPSIVFFKKPDPAAKRFFVFSAALT
jgi:hypothetical protein